MAQATATVLGGFFGEISSTYNTLADNNSNKKRAAQALGKRSNHRIRELAETLDGVVAGSAALKQHSEVTAPSDATPANTGGAMAIGTVDDVNRVSAVGDVTEINSDLLSHGGSNSSFPANGDGNPRGWSA